MKKLLIFLISFPLIGFSQIFVSTTAENKNIILEVFTGISCGNCPSGHQIAQQLHDANPNDVFLINIHTGQFANPMGPGTDFNTVFGPLLSGQAGIGGFPAGTVNRHQFSMSQSGGTAMGKSDWASATSQILSQLSPVNVGIESTIDMATNTLSVDVEVYYTGTQNVTSNMLNIVVVQNNVEGPQYGSGQLNGIYSHEHMLRHMITGTWGEQILNINPFTLYTSQYSWIMPANIQDVIFDPANISVLAFVSEGNQEILSGTEVTPDIVFEHDLDVDCISSTATSALCESETDIEVTFRNYGNQTLTSLDLNYSINGGASLIYPWTGNLIPKSQETISISGVSFIPQALNIVNIITSNPNGNIDQDITNDSTSIYFAGQILDGFVGGNINVNITTDMFANETSWKLINSNGIIIASVDSMTMTNSSVQATESVFLNTNECYSFIIYDYHGDGICCFFDNGSYSVTDALGDTIVSGGEFTFEEGTNFITNGNVTVVKDFTKNKELIKVIDMLGRDAKGIKNSPLLFIYDDGTIEKKIFFE